MEYSSRLDWTNVSLLPHEGGKITISTSVRKRVGDSENISDFQKVELVRQNKSGQRRNNRNTRKASWDRFIMQTNVILIFVSTFIKNIESLYLKHLFNRCWSDLIPRTEGRGLE